MASADLLRLAIVREATPGVTPANPVFQLLRATSESLSFSPETQLSNELSPHRQVTDVIVTGGQSGGSVEFEVSSNPGFELLLEAVLAHAWSGDQLWVGNTLYTHTLEKRFTLDEADPDPLARYEVNRFVRSLIDSMTLTFSPGGAATGSATILGGPMSRDNVDIPGATYTDPGQLPVIVGAGVLPVTFTIEGVDYAAWCVSNLVINFRNNGRAIACLGQEAANEVVLGRFECEMTADVYMAKGTDALMDAFINKTEIEFSVTAADALGNSYLFEFERVRLSACTQVAGGTNQDVVLSVTMQALLDDVTVGAGTESTCVLITREHVTAPWPGA
jgi:Phage tail tube protein